jgi:hypothetical protein
VITTSTTLYHVSRPGILQPPAFASSVTSSLPYAFAVLDRTAGSAQAGSSFLTKCTWLLTSYRRMRTGFNGCSR